MAWLAPKLLLAALLAGCATPSPPAIEGVEPAWSGRLALLVQAEPPQRASVAFDLRGRPQRGELLLSGPLGQTLAQVRWDETGAWLQRPDGTAERYPDMAALTEALTGAALPLAALFDWLDGRRAEIAGWTLLEWDAAAGRLHAQRHAPAPRVDLRVVWQPGQP